METDLLVMRTRIEELLADYELEPISPYLKADIQPAVRFALDREEPEERRQPFWKRL